WISIAPWSLNLGSTIINPAFTLLPAVIFFIGFLESVPYFTLKLIPKTWANVAMGFSLLCIMQLHFSWVYLAPLAVFSLGLQCLREQQWRSILSFILGTAPPLALIVPTYLRYGLKTQNVASGFAALFNFHNVLEGLTILARFLSLVSFEVPAFVGGGVSDTVHFLLAHPWILLPGALVCIAGLVQPFVLLISWFWKHGPEPQWREM